MACHGARLFILTQLPIFATAKVGLLRWYVLGQPPVNEMDRYGYCLKEAIRNLMDRKIASVQNGCLEIDWDKAAEKMEMFTFDSEEDVSKNIAFAKGLGEASSAAGKPQRPDVIGILHAKWQMKPKVTVKDRSRIASLARRHGMDTVLTIAEFYANNSTRFGEPCPSTYGLWMRFAEVAEMLDISLESETGNDG